MPGHEGSLLPEGGIDAEGTIMQGVKIFSARWHVNSGKVAL